MRVQRIVTGDIAENSYIVDNAEEAVVIDPGADYEKLRAAVGALPCVAVLLTHAHYDHIGVAARFRQAGAKVYLHANDEKLLKENGHLAALFGETLETFTPDVLLHGGETLSFCGTRFSVLSTPGHTDGSVCYLAENILFAGDTIFRLSVGRTDFPSGDAQKLLDSLHRVIFALPPDCRILPGHGEETTVRFEKENNPYA